MKRFILLLTFLALAACSGTGDDVAIVRLAPDRHRVLEYRDPPVEQRDRRVELVEDLVIGPRGEDPAFLFYWPQDVAVDGRGRMYVFSYTFRGMKPAARRVEVYDRDGRRVLAGSMDGDVWQAALGGYVYALRTDDVTGEEELVRYRLVEPF